MKVESNTLLISAFILGLAIIIPLFILNLSLKVEWQSQNRNDKLR